MKSVMINIRTDEELKENASKIYEAIGLNLSQAINLFLRQSVIEQRFPISLDSSIVKYPEQTYPENFFNLFGKGADLGLDEEPIDYVAEPDEDIKL